MTDIAPTRMELLKLKQREKLAKKGHSLLTRKRDALIREFITLARTHKQRTLAAQKRLETAFETLHVAQAVSGVNRLKSLAYSAEPAFTLTYTTKSIMGVKVPVANVSHKEASMNASLIGTSTYVKDARESFSGLVVELIALAEVEQALAALAIEIRKTKSRVNALEYIHIPRIGQQKKRIADRLSEYEREEFTRLKHIKEKLL